MNYLDILNNINKRFVLLKLNKIHYIIDKAKNNAVLIISDPIINYNALIKEMKKRQVKVYTNHESLIVEKSENTQNIFYYKEGRIYGNQTEEVKTLNLILRKIYNQNNDETGCIISANTNQYVNKNDKERIEKKITHFAFHNLYPKIGLNIYSDINDDTISIVIIKDINTMEYKELEAIEKIIIDW